MRIAQAGENGRGRRSLTTFGGERIRASARSAGSLEVEVDVGRFSGPAVQPGSTRDGSTRSAVRHARISATFSMYCAPAVE